MATTNQELKTNPWLHAYRGEEGGESRFIIEDFANQRRFACESTWLVPILGFCTTPRTLDAIAAHLSDVVPRADVARLVDSFVELGLLLPTDAPAHRVAARAETWERHGWGDALDFFVTIKDYPFLDYQTVDGRSTDTKRMQQYTREDELPDIYKSYAGAETIALPDPEDAFTDVDFWASLPQPATAARKATSPTLTRATLGNILFFSSGKLGHIRFPSQGTLLKKAVPSGGARHPAEAYAIVLRPFDGLAEGLYHYAVQGHALERLPVQASRTQIEEGFFDLRNDLGFEPQVLLVYSAVFPRSMWRYREPRSYRAVLHDIGHVTETVKLVCRAAELSAYVGHGFREEVAEPLLDSERNEESILRTVAIG